VAVSTAVFEDPLLTMVPEIPVCVDLNLCVVGLLSQARFNSLLCAVVGKLASSVRHVRVTHRKRVPGRALLSGHNVTGFCVTGHNLQLASCCSELNKTSSQQEILTYCLKQNQLEEDNAQTVDA